MNMIRTIIIDDERLARQEMRYVLRAFPDIEVVGEASCVEDAHRLIRALRPNLIFLDIQLAGASGFDLLELLDHVPGVIFTTAYQQYAVKAFETNAMDYLVKPIRRERLEKAVGKARQKAGAGQERFFIKDGDRMFFVNASDVFLIESAGNYARLFYGEKKVYIKRSLNQLESSLDRRSFFRISRTRIINMNFIKEVYPLPKGKLNITLIPGGVYAVSGRQSVQFRTINPLS